MRITLQDLSAIDPDDTADALTFTVSQVRNGFVTLATDPARPGGRVHAGRPRAGHSALSP